MIALSGSKSPPSSRQPSFRPSDLYKIHVSIAGTGEHIPLLVEAHTRLSIARPNRFVLVIGATDAKCLDEARLVASIDALRIDYRTPLQSNVVALHRPLVSTGVWATRVALTRNYIAWNVANTLAKCEPGRLRYQHVRGKLSMYAESISTVPGPMDGKGLQQLGSDDFAKPCCAVISPTYTAPSGPSARSCAISNCPSQLPNRPTRTGFLPRLSVMTSAERSAHRWLLQAAASRRSRAIA